MDGVYTENAGAIFGDRHGWRPLSIRGSLPAILAFGTLGLLPVALGLLPIVYAENAGAIFGDRQWMAASLGHPSEGLSRPSWPSGHSGSRPSCMPEMREQFPVTNIYSPWRCRCNVSALTFVMIDMVNGRSKAHGRPPF